MFLAGMRSPKDLSVCCSRFPPRLLCEYHNEPRLFLAIRPFTAVEADGLLVPGWSLPFHSVDPFLLRNRFRFSKQQASNASAAADFADEQTIQMGIALRSPDGPVKCDRCVAEERLPLGRDEKPNGLTLPQQRVEIGLRQWGDALLERCVLLDQMV